jgi:outer membrane protein assembly factor BamD (BamD/ComL family)
MFTACSIFEEEPTKTTLPAEQIYQQAKDKLNKEEYKEALVDYELLRRISIFSLY